MRKANAPGRSTSGGPHSVARSSPSRPKMPSTSACARAPLRWSSAPQLYSVMASAGARVVGGHPLVHARHQADRLADPALVDVGRVPQQARRAQAQRLGRGVARRRRAPRRAGRSARRGSRGCARRAAARSRASAAGTTRRTARCRGPGGPAGSSTSRRPAAQSSADQKYAVQPHTTGPSVLAVGSRGLDRRGVRLGAVAHLVVAGRLRVHVAVGVGPQHRLVVEVVVGARRRAAAVAVAADQVARPSPCTNAGVDRRSLVSAGSLPVISLPSARTPLPQSGSHGSVDCCAPYADT